MAAANETVAQSAEPDARTCLRRAFGRQVPDSDLQAPNDKVHPVFRGSPRFPWLLRKKIAQTRPIQLKAAQDQQFAPWFAPIYVEEMAKKGKRAGWYWTKMMICCR